MPLYRVVDGPLEHNGSILVPAGAWAVLSMARVPDPEDTTVPYDPGTVVALCVSEQEAERKARELLFGPDSTPARPDPLDALLDDPGDDGDGVWEIEQLEDEADEDTEIEE